VIDVEPIFSRAFEQISTTDRAMRYLVGEERNGREPLSPRP